jgi:hypothetical protein
VQFAPQSPHQSHLHSRRARGGASRHAPASTEPCCNCRESRHGAPPRPLAETWIHPPGWPRGAAAAVTCSPTATMFAATLLLADQHGQKARPPALLVEAGRLSSLVEDVSTSTGSLRARRTAGVRMDRNEVRIPWDIG